MTTRTSRYFTIVDDGSQSELLVHCDGPMVLRDPTMNKGTAFTLEERLALGLDGQFPEHVSSLEEQVDRTYISYSVCESPLAKYQFLRGLQDRNETLFFALLERHVEEMLPIVYTPTVGEAIRIFSRIFRTPRGVTLSPGNIERAPSIFQDHPLGDVRMVVATDSSAILGIGDQGYGGIGICIGKLALYSLGGLAPYKALPVSLDVGTDRKNLLEDPLYLGARIPRLRGDAYLEIVDRFVAAVHARYPKAIIQWEDLSKDTAFDVLERFRDKVPSFNDDIQGTGAVALAGLIGATRARGERLADQVFVIHGAGAGGAGVALAIVEGLRREGLTPEEAHARVFMLDSKGLLVEGREVERYKEPFLVPRARLEGWRIEGAFPSLHETIEHAKATVLLGLSGQAGAFDERAVRLVASHCPRPIVMPLSNPTTSCEALPADVLRWTDGRALVATGSPFPPVAMPDGSTREIGQGNNAFVFPGLGFGATLVEASRITDGMVSEAAYALADYVAEHHQAAGHIYPPVSELRAVALEVARRVAAQAIRDGVATRDGVTEEGLRELVATSAYRPRYLPTRRA